MDDLLFRVCAGQLSRSRQRGSTRRHQDLREGSALEALFIDDVELQVLSQLGKWTLPRADRDWDRGQLVLVDEAQAGQRPGEVRPAVDQHRAVVVTSLQL